MSTMYHTDFTKYHGISFTVALDLLNEFKKQYHTCPSLMEKKKNLEKVVRRYNSLTLKNFFKTPFRERKTNFYREVITIITKDRNSEVLSETEKQILKLVQDILFIYSQKRNEGNYLDDLINDISARQNHEEEMRESFMEDFRGCD